MLKFFATALVAASLAACGTPTTNTSVMGNAAETKNSTDSNKSGNAAAASPGTGGAAGGAPGTL